MIKSILIVVALTIVSGGAGAFQGLQIYAMVSSGQAQNSSNPKKQPAHEDLVVKDLKPIITNLVGGQAWVRLEAALLAEKKAQLDDKSLGEINNDIVGYLRTLSPGQLEGASGLRRLRDDLNERLIVRSNNHIREILIQTMVVQ